MPASSPRTINALDRGRALSDLQRERQRERATHRLVINILQRKKAQPNRHVPPPSSVIETLNAPPVSEFVPLKEELAGDVPLGGSAPTPPTQDSSVEEEDPSTSDQQATNPSEEKNSKLTKATDLAADAYDLYDDPATVAAQLAQERIFNLLNLRRQQQQQTAVVATEEEKRQRIYKIRNAFKFVFLAAGIKDVSDIALVGSFPGVGTVVTLIASTVIAIILLSLGAHNKKAQARQLVRQTVKKILIFLLGTLGEALLFGLNFLPMELLTVWLIRRITLHEVGQQTPSSTPSAQPTPTPQKAT